MRKILISAVIVLFLVLAYMAIFRGISIANFQVLSVKQIKNENDKLTSDIENAQKIMQVDYPNRTLALETSISELLDAENEYYDLADVSTNSELKKANQEEEYTIEFLLTNLGRHARAQGVDLTFTPTKVSTGSRELSNISFNVNGSYTAVINFLIALEDDSKLGFRIYNFKMLPTGSDVQATFTVMNINVKFEETNSSAQSQQKSTTDTTNNTQSSSENNKTTKENTQTENTTSDTTNKAGNNSNQAAEDGAASNEQSTTDGRKR